MTIQLKNKPEHLTQTYNFKHVINHVDITQAEAEFVEKYGHLLDNNNLITRTLVDYEAKTITIEAYSTNLFHPRKDNRRGFIFDLNVAPHTSYKDLLKVFEPLGIVKDDFQLYPNSNYLVTTSNKLTKEIIESAKEVIELENRTNTFTKTYHFDKRPTIQNLLDSQLKFITDNKLHEDDIIYVGINTDEKYLYNNYFNTITITGRQSAKHKTYTDDVAAIIKSCIIVDRFDSCRHSAINTGGYDNLIERIISYQHPIVDSNSLELLESSVNITQVLEDITNKDGHINLTSSNVLEVNEEDIAEFITDIPNNVDELIAETKAYQELQIRKNKSYYPPKDLVFTEDEIQKLKDFLKSL